MKEQIKKLRIIEIKNLTKQIPSDVFKTKTEVVYASQHLLFGMVKVSGKMTLYSKKHEAFSVPDCTMLGVYELLYKIPSQYSCEISPNTEIIIINRTEILESLKQRKDQLFKILNENYLP